MSLFEPNPNLLVTLGAFFAQSTALILVGLLVSRRLTWNAAARHTVLLATLLSAGLLPMADIGCSAGGVSLLPYLRELCRSQFTASGSEASGGDQNSDFAYVYSLPPDGTHDLVPTWSDEPLHAGFPLLPVIAIVWLLGIGVLSLRFFAALVDLGRLTSRACQTSDQVVQRLCREHARRLKLKAPPRVFFSKEFKSPAAIGLFRPAIFLPSNLASTISEDQLSDVLLHELAHIKRLDHMVLALQKLLSVLFWPQPLVHVLNRSLSRAREEICDNYVLLSGERVRYGRTLLQLGEAASAAFSLGLSDGHWKLEDRISNLLNDRRKPMINSNPLLKCVALGIAMVCTMILSTVTPSWAETNQSDADADEATKISFFTIESDPGDSKKRAHITISSDDNEFVARELHFVVAAEPDWTESELSPSDKKEAERLQREYKELQDEQKKLAKRLQDVEGKLREIGVPIRMSYHLRTDPKYRRRAVSVTEVDVSVDATVPLPAVRPTQPASPVARPMPAPSAKPIARDESVPTPTIKGRRARRSRSGGGFSYGARPPANEKSLEDRLQRLEKMMEELIDASRGSSDQPPRRRR